MTPLHGIRLGSRQRRWLQGHMDGEIRFNEPMAQHTSLEIGGPAEVYVQPGKVEDLKQLLPWCLEQKIPYLIVGRGTNLVVRDRGIKGIVINLQQCLAKISVRIENSRQVTISARAGIQMQSLCRFALENGWGGLNFALGIPGSVGGCLRMNAGTHLGAMQDVLSGLTLLHASGKSEYILKNELSFAYRRLNWPGQNPNEPDQGAIILEGRFCLQAAERRALKAEAARRLKERRKKQPLDLPSAGSVFKNPPDAKSAGELIEAAGLKGKSMGGAMVSPRHANFIVNTGNATAADFLELMALVRETVAAKFQVELEPEVQIVGET